MQTDSSNSKKILIAAAAFILLGFAAYYFFFRTVTPETTLDEFGNPVEASVVGQDLIDLSRQLESIKLDTGSLKKKTFTSLVDFGISLPLQSIGRNNPFADFGFSVDEPVDGVR